MCFARGDDGFGDFHIFNSSTCVVAGPVGSMVFTALLAGIVFDCRRVGVDFVGFDRGVGCHIVKQNHDVATVVGIEAINGPGVGSVTRVRRSTGVVQSDSTGEQIRFSARVTNRCTRSIHNLQTAANKGESCRQHVADLHVVSTAIAVPCVFNHDGVANRITGINAASDVCVQVRSG